MRKSAALLIPVLLLSASWSRADITQWMVDLSSNNAGIAVERGLQLGGRDGGFPVEMIIHRATLGKFDPPLHKGDALFSRRAAEAHNHGIHFGAYHVAYPTADVDVQVSGFLKRVKDSCNPGQRVVLALDWEHVCVRWQDKSKALCAQEGIVPPSDAVQFLEEVEKRTGVAPILYTSVRALKTFDKVLQKDPDLHGRLQKYPLWLARYHGKGGVFYFPTESEHFPWPQWTFWQFAEGKGSGPTKRVALSIQNQPVDTNFYNGPRSEAARIVDQHGWRCSEAAKNAGAAG